MLKKPTNPLAFKMLKKLIALRRKGLSIKQIAKIVGFTYQGVSWYFIKYGVKDDERYGKIKR